ncbi:ABC transporter G family member 20 [Eurytemora carolleeae]|uniref:ABC transporter G family member 20 n=1 Tax=Eurytemora carolleeae TaxID=1294199 RepID=UPI000C78EB90|nr:ABC transporter G family member 20 [Eurytemora carolleeae]|eukprot:XP_023345381.1 ABC transporter G family member 20-like [Eurytemora affinis]
MEKLNMETLQSNAIVIENAYKSYQSGKKSNPIFTNLNLTVQKGKIYGLLGPSGCGKTTLLKCMVGKLRLDAGKVRVFGSAPGDRNTGVPGARVGYMPQELALFGEFNIEETLKYFSRIFGMSEEKFQVRLEFLMKFLDLPSKSRKLELMSGGQQRRASLAVALLHQPELLILDEPTVGVDPLLRQSIWEHLIQLADGEDATTVVITTHYTEEAMQANRVGMLRNGRLLAEDSPNNLLRTYAEPGLEEVFLRLCHVDGAVLGDTNIGSAEPGLDDEKRRTLNLLKNEDGEEKIPDINFIDSKTEQDERVDDKPVLKYNRSRFSPRVVQACMFKTFNRMSKRWGFLIYQFVLPALQVSLFCLAIGQDPKELPISIVSDELVNGTHCEYFSLGNLSCRFINYLDDSTIQPIWQPSYQAAVESVELGQSWGIVYMGSNFSNALYSRVMESGLMPGGDDDIDSKAGKIQIQLDVTNQQIAFTVQLKLAQAFQRFVDQLATVCHISGDAASLPLEFQEPVYGTDRLTFTDFMAPGIILTIVHSMALGYSAMIILIERNEGLLDRTWVAGVTSSELSVAHFLCAVSVNLVQVIVTLAFMIGVFKVPVEGSLILLFVLTLLQGLCGTTIGLIISSVCQTQQDATQIALGIFYPNMILSG